MTLRNTMAMVFAIGCTAAHAGVVTERTGGVVWLRGGMDGIDAPELGAAPRSRSISVASRETAAMAVDKHDDDRAVPFVGPPGALRQLAAYGALPVPHLAAMHTVMPMVNRTASDLQMDPALLLAVIHAESGFDPDALSPKGAVGLMQLIPATARRYGADDPRDPASNVRAGAGHLRYLLARYGDLPLALAAYNAGEGAVERHGMRVPPYPETRQYIPRVMGLYRAYQLRLPQGTPVRLSNRQNYQENP